MRRTVLATTALGGALATAWLGTAQVGPGFWPMLRPAPTIDPAVAMAQSWHHPQPAPVQPPGMPAGYGTYSRQGAHNPVIPQGERTLSHSHGLTARTHGNHVALKTVAPNQEGAFFGDPVHTRPSPYGFRLSVDGQTLSGAGFEREAHQLRTDTALERAKVQLRVDGLDVEPRLNVGIAGDATRVPIHRPVEFVAYSNYENFFARGEVRIFTPGRDGAASHLGQNAVGFLEQRQPVLSAPIGPDGRAWVQLPPNLPSDLLYQVRVYDRHGRFDETVLKPFSTVEDTEIHGHPAVPFNDAGLGVYGKDATLRRNIPVRGSAVTVNGTDVPPGFTPILFGRAVPVDPKGAFAVQQILPFGPQTVRVDIQGPYGPALTLNRDIELRETDLFYVALGDLTIGPRGAIGLADLADPGDDFDKVEVTGRGAFYLKGRIRGGALITAALDTGHAPLDELLSNLDDKDPRQLLRRIDADAYYPVYGDNSTLREDAPTQGRFYVRLERNDNTLLWGNFATSVTGTEIAQLDRGLYGALGDYNSQSVTRFGERRTEATLFAADPGTLPGRDEFRGTGGSLYFLQRQDISVGSERLRVELRDPLTGLVVNTRDLVAFEDYDIDPLQGRILLTEPLQSTSDDERIVRTGGLSGLEAYLVARYEFTPAVGDIDGYTVGGRATHWLTDRLRFGITGQTETTASADQQVLAADVLLRASETSYIKGEYGQSDGPGFDEARSTDGGFLFDDLSNPGMVGQTAEAYRVEAQLDAADLAQGRLPFAARLRGLFERQDAGYSGAGRIGFGRVEREEVSLDAGVEDRSNLTLRYAALRSQLRGRSREMTADVVQTVRQGIAVALGLRHSDQDPSTIANLSPNSPRGTGKRTDGTIELRLAPSADTELRLFYQDTLRRDAGRFAFARHGLRGSFRLGERMRFSGEVSDGDGGIGAAANLSFQNGEGAEYYVGYALAADSQDDLSTTRREAAATYGTITAGTRQRFSDSLSVYGEEQIALGRRGRDLTHAYGIDFTPWENWAFGASIEVGTIEDDVLGDFDRQAVSLSMGRTGEALRFSTNLEARFEDGVLNGQARDRETYLIRNMIAWDAGRDVEMLGRLNAAWSETDGNSLLDADFVEGVLAFAYRPVEYDRLNMLGKYTFFENLAPADQADANVQRFTARQRSHVMSLDGIFDVTPKLSIGAKGAYRAGEVELDRGTGIFVDSEAWLGVLRADYHIIDRWDVFTEGRVLSASLTQDERFGAVIGVHRHLNDNFKLGAGYSFVDFSDDLTDFNNDADGWFINIVGKL